MITKNNVNILSLILMVLCTQHTHAASNSFPQSLATHHSIPVTMGTVLGYAIGHQFDHSVIGAASLAGATIGTLAGFACYKYLLSNKISLHITTHIKHKKSTESSSSSPALENNSYISTPTTKPPQQFLSEFEALKQALYKTRGERFKNWFQACYTHKYPTKEAAWALYWQTEDAISDITNDNGQLKATILIGEHSITLTDTIWQDMLSIKNRILKNNTSSDLYK